MAVESRCIDCGVTYCFTNDLTGREVICDECGSTFVIGVYAPNTKPNDVGKTEVGIKTAEGSMQSQAPRLLSRSNEADEPISRLSKPKKSGCSILQIVVLLAAVLVGGCGGFPILVSLMFVGGGDNKETEAKVGIWSLEDAVVAYYLDYQKYPETLKELTETLPDGRPAKLDEKAIIDPWGKPYQLEPKNLDPKTKKPRIWSSGEPGAGRPITNW
jgi:hypothetical protein